MYGGNRNYQNNYGSRDRSRDKGRRDRSYERDDYEGSRRRRRSRSSSEQSRRGRHRRDSRSNSRDRQSQRQTINQTYPQRHMEQTEQKLRIAIRNNELHFNAKLLQILHSMPLSKQEQLKYQADAPQKINECILVRELFISGLQEMNDPFIREHMKQYGDIEKIEIVRNFAYVKFNKVSDASNACAEYHTINMRIHNSHNPNFKIFFSDHIKRWNVVSNSIDYEEVDDLVPVVYASLRNDPPYNTEEHLRQVFNKFGFVRKIDVKIPTMKSYKTYALIEMETLTQALRARERVRGQRERYLGDRKSEITILIDAEKYTRKHPNVKNQLRYQIKRQNNANPGNSTQINKSFNPFMQHMEPPKPQPQQQLQQQVMSVPSHEAASDIFAIIREFTEKEPELEADESDWVGFMTRKKQFKVEVDFNLIHKMPFELEGILNVSHRGDLQEGITREDYVMAGKFRASNNLNVNAFNEYINYFIRKNRAGIIQSKNYLIYLLPPMENLPLPYPIKSDQLLALFFKL